MPEADDIRDNVKAQKLRADAAASELATAASEVDDLVSQVANAERLLRERGAEPASAVPPGSAGLVVSHQAPETLGELTAANRSWLMDAGLSDLALEDVLSAAELDELESFDPLGRERWCVGDFVTVGGCAAIGVLAAIFDDQIDLAVKSGLRGLGQSDVVRGWEKAGKQLPVDYTGPGFGGPGHRVRSAGHDIGRPFAALRQIVNGEFTGTEWIDGVQHPVVVGGFAPHTMPEALVLWLKHLVADLVTTTSLPLPWWSELYECDSRDLRKLAHSLYNPGDGTGLNVRSVMLSKTLPVITTEIVIGVKVHFDARSRRGSFGPLTGDEKLRRNEMLLAGHAATGLASIGKVVVTAPGENLLGLRHLNAPALARVGWQAVKVVREHDRRRKARQVPSWEQLIRMQAPPWEIDELAIIRAAG